MPGWASRLIATRRAAQEGSEQSIRDAIAEVRASGTTLVGEVTNTLASYEPLVDSLLSAAVFFEQLGFRGGDASVVAAAARSRIERLRANPRLRVSVVAHAPYSVSAALMQAIGAAGSQTVQSIHLGESVEELQFLQDGSGAWRGLLQALGVWDDAWSAPACGPVEYLDRLGMLDDRLLAVHGVQLTDGELERLAAARATVVACPRSNAWTGAGTPPIERFYRSGVRVAVGTDSLASVETLNMFDELARVRTMAPTVSASTLLESATRSGADALGFGAELGTISPRKRAELIAVRLPADAGDVEEYLVRGIQPHDVQWLDPA
jgi:cytosine/adenosine deaminase-related metal-dependent hydrolase